MISALMVKCLKCRRKDQFVTKQKTPTVRTLAQRAGWNERKGGWICQDCRMGEPSEPEKDK